MSLPGGKFITSVDGRRCTAVPRRNRASGGVFVGTTPTPPPVAVPPSATPPPPPPPPSPPPPSIPPPPTLTTSEVFGSEPAPISVATSEPAAVSSPRAIPDTTPLEPAISTSIGTSVTGEITSLPSSLIVAPSATGSRGAPATQPLNDPGISVPPGATVAPSQDQLPASTGNPSGPAPSENLRLGSTSSGTGPLPTGSSDTPASQGAGDTGQRTKAVVGGVIGGVASAALFALLIWFLCRRKKKRRDSSSSVLTPLSTAPGFGDVQEKGYIIHRGSLGPTPVIEKAGATVAYNYGRLRNRVLAMFSGPSHRETDDEGRHYSQFQPLNDPSSHSRSNSDTQGNSAMNSEMGNGGQYVDWWNKLTEDGDMNWRISNTEGPRTSNAQANREAATPPFGSLGDNKTTMTAAATAGALASVPGEQQAGPRPQPNNNTIDEGGSEINKNHHFLGGLRLNFDSLVKGNSLVPSASIVSHQSARVAPLRLGAADSRGGASTELVSSIGNRNRTTDTEIPATTPENPFLDSNVVDAASTMTGVAPIKTPSATAPPSSFSSTSRGWPSRRKPSAATKGPTTYVDNLRRSRGPSVDANKNNNPPALQPPLPAAATTGILGANPSITTNHNPFNYVTGSQPNPQERRGSGSQQRQNRARGHVRNSRGSSIGYGGNNKPPSSFYLDTPRESEYYGEQESFNTHRQRVKSDPFDLDRPELLTPSHSGSNSSSSAAAGDNGAAYPRKAHVRQDSYTSRLSSEAGSSFYDGWSDPGPDVGPASASGGVSEGKDKAVGMAL